MWARKNNGNIDIFNCLPSIWNNYFNFSEGGIEILEGEGFFHLIEPELEANQQYGDIIFDRENKVFKYLVEQIPIKIPTNKQIQSIRQENYKQRSDSYFIAYQKYIALNNPIKAEENKTLWLEEISKIDIEFPYI